MPGSLSSPSIIILNIPNTEICSFSSTGATSSSASDPTVILPLLRCLLYTHLHLPLHPLLPHVLHCQPILFQSICQNLCTSPWYPSVWILSTSSPIEPWNLPPLNRVVNWRIGGEGEEMQKMWSFSEKKKVPLQRVRCLRWWLRPPLSLDIEVHWEGELMEILLVYYSHTHLFYLPHDFDDGSANFECRGGNAQREGFELSFEWCE